MKLHPRHNITDAGAWLRLTYGEHLAAVAECMSTQAKYKIREERHGNTTTPG